MKELVEIIAKSLVDAPDQVVVTETTDEHTITVELTVAPDDMGKVIGKSGRIAKAIRTVVKAAASKSDKKVIVDIKTTQHISGMHKVGYRAQLNLYRLAAIRDVAVDELWGLQLKKDGTYKLHQMDVDEPLAQACITLHEAFKQTKRRKKKDG